MDVSVGHFYKPFSPLQQTSASLVAGTLGLVMAVRLGVISTLVVAVLVLGTMAALGRGLSRLSYARQRRESELHEGVELAAEAVESGRAGTLRVFGDRVAFVPKKGGPSIGLLAAQIGHVYLTPINRFVVATHVSLVPADGPPLEMNVTAPGRDVERAFRRCEHRS